MECSARNNDGVNELFECATRVALTVKTRHKIFKTRNKIMTPIRRKLVISDNTCEKTSLLIVFSNCTFPEVYVPKIFENKIADVEVDDRHVELTLWDTASIIYNIIINCV